MEASLVYTYVHIAYCSQALANEVRMQVEFTFYGNCEYLRSVLIMVNIRTHDGTLHLSGVVHLLTKATTNYVIV